MYFIAQLTVLDPSHSHRHKTPLPWRLLDVHPSKEIRLGMDVVIKAFARVPIMFELITTAIEALSITCNKITLLHTIYWGDTPPLTLSLTEFSVLDPLEEVFIKIWRSHVCWSFGDTLCSFFGFPRRRGCRRWNWCGWSDWWFCKFLWTWRWNVLAIADYTKERKTQKHWGVLHSGRFRE